MFLLVEIQMNKRNYYGIEGIGNRLYKLFCTFLKSEGC